MIIRTSIVTGLAAILLSTAALADSATTTPATSTPKQKPTEQSQKLADRCAALETQFDQAIATHGNAAKAQALIDEVQALIAAGPAAREDWRGIASASQRLRQAWSRLGTIDRKE